MNAKKAFGIALVVILALMLLVIYTLLKLVAPRGLGL